MSRAGPACLGHAVHPHVELAEGLHPGSHGQLVVGGRLVVEGGHGGGLIM